MRFLNENYLRAFPREEKFEQQIQHPKQIVKDEPGDVLDTADEQVTETSREDPDPADPEVIDDGA